MAMVWSLPEDAFRFGPDLDCLDDAVRLGPDVA
jgi:hypothetical protein